MFTLQQIKDAHSKVKSGADFPAYIREIKQLGVTGYQTFVTDGHTEYTGGDNYRVSSDAKYAALAIAPVSNKATFEGYLKAHQQGQSDYPAFCQQSADTGVEKWVVNTDTMTCTYYDLAGNVMLEEKIPG